MEFIYPKENNSIFLPKDFDGNTNEMILKMTHSKPESTLFWYIDNTFIANTKDIHELAILPKEGKHIITAVDEFGNEVKRYFEIKK